MKATNALIGSNRRPCEQTSNTFTYKHKNKKEKKRKKGIKKKTLLTAGSVTGDNPEISMQSRL